MPMVAAALTKMIATRLAVIPIAVTPEKMSVASVPNPDGTVVVTAVPGAATPVFLDKGTINAISIAVAESVVTFLQTSAVAQGPSSPGTIVSKIL